MTTLAPLCFYIVVLTYWVILYGDGKAARN